MADHSKDTRLEFLTARQLAEHLQVSESTVHRLRRAGRIPAVLLTDRLIRFSLRDVRNALRGRYQSDASGRGAEHDEGPSPQLSFDDLNPDFTGKG